MTKDRAGLRVVPADECLLLLEDHLPRIGRVAFVRDGRPIVLPVNYRLDGDAIIFRTGPDTALAQLASGERVAFQADEADATWAEGWSVLADGHAEQVTDPDELDRLRRLPLHSWAPGDRSLFVRIRPESMTGRRIE